MKLMRADSVAAARMGSDMGETDILASSTAVSRAEVRRKTLLQHDLHEQHHLPSCGILATIRIDADNSSNCSQGRIQAMASYAPDCPGTARTCTFASRNG